MAAQIFEICRNDPSYIGMSLKIRDPIISHPPRRQIRTRRNSSTFVKQIDLNFKVQLKCSLYVVNEEGSRNLTTSLGEQVSSQHPFASYQIPVSILKHGDKTLERYLLQQFRRYRDIINIKLVANKIIKHWVEKVEEEEGENNSRVFGKVYPLEIMIELMLFERVDNDTIEVPIMMVPANDSAMESMLKKVEIDEMIKLGDDESINCVICMEEISRDEKEKNETLVLQMPCLHMFHEECIKKWLKTSHYCPTCRFSMPTNN